VPKASEVAVITVNGQDYKDWESIAVTIEFPGQFRLFRASVSEQKPTAKTMAAAQIKTGDFCSVTLGGSPVLEGYIYERQTALDANTHGVQVAGKGLVSDTIRSSIDIEKLGNGGEFKQQTIRQIAPKILQPFKITPVFKGNEKNFRDRLDEKVRTGEAAFHFLERICRQIGAFVGDDHKGNYVFYGGLIPKGTKSGDALIEGKNIKWIRCVINDEHIMSNTVGLAQANGTNKTWGTPINTVKFEKKGSATRYKPYVFLLERMAENASFQDAIKDRVEFEIAWRDGTKITAEVTVQGWHKSNGRLWEAGPDELVDVHSPSCMVTESLAVRQVTFSQSNDQGTITTLGLVSPKFYGGGVALSGGT
jgi:prophage tail gpP-like protein